MENDEISPFSDDSLKTLTTPQLRLVVTHFHKNNVDLRNQLQQLTDFYHREQEQNAVLQAIVQSQQVWTTSAPFYPPFLTTLSSCSRLHHDPIVDSGTDNIIGKWNWIRQTLMGRRYCSWLPRDETCRPQRFTNSTISRVGLIRDIIVVLPYPFTRQFKVPPLPRLKPSQIHSIDFTPYAHSSSLSDIPILCPFILHFSARVMAECLCDELCRVDDHLRWPPSIHSTHIQSPYLIAFTWTIISADFVSARILKY